MENHEPERLILKLPKWLFRSKALAFCMTRRLAVFRIIIGIIFIFLLIAVGVTIPLGHLIAVSAIIGGIIFLLLILSALPTIFVRKDCSKCQFFFHILAHERTHLDLQSSDEMVVEKETLRKTQDQIIPILLSNAEICDDCPFSWRKIYCQATFNYIKKREDRNKKEDRQG